MAGDSKTRQDKARLGAEAGPPQVHPAPSSDPPPSPVSRLFRPRPRARALTRGPSLRGRHQAYGLTALPIGMIRGRARIGTEVIEVREDLAETRSKQATLQSKVRGARAVRRSGTRAGRVTIQP